MSLAAVQSTVWICSSQYQTAMKKISDKQDIVHEIKLKKIVYRTLGMIKTNYKHTYTKSKTY